MANEEIREKILSEIELVEQQIVDYKESSKPMAPDVAIGRISRMDAITNRSVTENALRQAQDRLVKLRQALSKLDRKDFGICAKCGKEIPLGRILIKPESPFCVNCAQ